MILKARKVSASPLAQKSKEYPFAFTKNYHAETQRQTRDSSPRTSQVEIVGISYKPPKSPRELRASSDFDVGSRLKRRQETIDTFIPHPLGPSIALGKYPPLMRPIAMTPVKNVTFKDSRLDLEQLERIPMPRSM